MKTFKKLLLITIFSIITSQSFAKNIVIVATGGTIAGAGSSSIGAKYAPSQLSIEQVLSAVPGIEKLASIKTEQILNIASQDMNDESWLKISKKVDELLRKQNVDGVVVTHGTDTLEETAYFLNLTVKSKKPIVVVGSMRPSTSLSADGPINLYNATALAANNQSVNKGVLVVFADKIFAARDVSKIHTTNVSAFDSPNFSAIGSVYYGNPEIYYQPLRGHTKYSEFDVRDLTILPKVEIVYMYPGFDATIIDNLVTNGTQGIVIAGVGDGNVYKDALPKLIAASKKGVLIVRSSKTGAGAVEPNIEINDDEYGFVTAGNLSPNKARILAKLALTKTSKHSKIQEIFDRY